ncbi:hypothetical protein ACOMHN_001234 [Nucella lapillus]
MEATQEEMKKAIKATIILLPLLGITNLLFLLQPARQGPLLVAYRVVNAILPSCQGPLLVAYRVVNAILPSCQGIFVSVLYCFMNVEVQSVIRKKWNRFRVNRALNTRSRRQGSRTSSFFLSQSEVVFVYPSARKKAITEKKEVVSSSIAQDMCYAVTNGTWKMPKHVLLGTAIRHLTGSAEMISITNHFGHCISHSSVLELETDVCNSLLQSNSLLPATILKEDNVTLHFCWDNFDLQEETASGAGTTHSAHGIAIQEVTSGTQVTPHLQELEQQHSSRQRTVDYQPQPLQPCFVNQKVEPKLNIVETRMFHFLCSYMAALGKLVRGSGLGDVIVQSGICASGSIEAVLAGKHYNRALRVHKVVLESLQRLLLEQFLNESTEATELFQQLSDDLQLCKDRLQLEAILSKPSAVRFFNLYTTFKERIISGEKGSTPQFWLQYAERVWLILRLLRATKENDFDLHLSCLQDMCPLLFAMDHHNYARYATVYFLHMLNLSHNHPDAI